MREIRTQIDIEASPERVWQVLTDIKSFPEWNPFMRRGEGEFRVGERVKLFLNPPGAMGITIKPGVLKAETGSELRWLGHLLVPGIFDGEHYFLIEPADEGTVRFIQGEKFRGFLVPLLGLMRVFKSTQVGFVQMNQALKERAEEAFGGLVTPDPPLQVGS